MFKGRIHGRGQGSLGSVMSHASKEAHVWGLPNPTSNTRMSLTRKNKPEQMCGPCPHITLVERGNRLWDERHRVIIKKKGEKV